MATSRETMLELMTRMRKTFDEVNSKGLQENRRIFDIAGLQPPLPVGVTVETQAVNEQLNGDWLTPSNFSSNASTSAYASHPLILYFHGGGYSVGSSLSHRPLCARLAYHSGCKVFSLNYRLAPEHKFPAALDDALSAYGWLRQHHPDSKILIAGDSAGGGLAFACLLALKEKKLPQPDGAIGLSAWLDLDCSSASYGENRAFDLMASQDGLRFVGRAYASKQINKNPLVSPFYAADLAGLCPLLIQVGDAETLRDENILFAGKARAAGVSVELQLWPNMVHVWHSLYGEIPEAREAIEAIALWIKNLTGEINHGQ